MLVYLHLLGISSPSPSESIPPLRRSPPNSRSKVPISHNRLWQSNPRRCPPFVSTPTPLFCISEDTTGNITTPINTDFSPRLSHLLVVISLFSCLTRLVSNLRFCHLSLPALQLWFSITNFGVKILLTTRTLTGTIFSCSFRTSTLTVILLGLISWCPSCSIGTGANVCESLVLRAYSHSPLFFHNGPLEKKF